MKNLILKPILLPTEDVSPIYKIGEQATLYCGTRSHYTDSKRQHLYLCSSEEIKEGDWVLRPDKVVMKMSNKDMLDYLESESSATKKIIFTTDHELIVNGVPAIDGNTKAMIKEELTDTYFQQGYEVSFLEEYCKRHNQLCKWANDEIGKIPAYETGLTAEESKNEDRKIVAAQQYALSKCGAGEMGALTKVKLAWENGFETSQAIQSTGRFSLEDNFRNFIRENHLTKKWEDYIRSLTPQPKEIVIECEMEELKFGKHKGGYGEYFEDRIQIKLTDGHPTLIIK